MIDHLTYIIWNVNPDLFPGFIFPIRKYGLLFALGFLVSQQILIWMLKKEAPIGEKFKKRAEKDVEVLTIYLVVATILGARLGHVLFYEPAKYLSNPLDIFKIWEGGLASHGAAIGILFALWLFAKKYRHWTWLRIVDRIVVVVAVTGCLIRLGNFMNSEIYGVPTESSYGVVFTRHATDALVTDKSPVESIEYEKMKKSEAGLYVPVKMILHFKQPLTEEQINSFVLTSVRSVVSGRYGYISDHLTFDTSQRLQYSIGEKRAEVSLLGIPRHPTQLYESATSLLIFIVLLAIWWQYKAQTPPGRLFSIFLIALFGLRIFHETFKVNQVDFEETMALNMGQWLSIPLVIAGIIILIRSFQLAKTVQPQGTGS